MKLLILLVFMFVNLKCFGQEIKKQIGTSVWLKNNIVFADSTVSYIVTYGQNGRKVSEWQIFRDSSGLITDTNYVELDTMERPIYMLANKEHWYWEYDSMGTEQKITIQRLNDTLIMQFHPTYKNGKLVKTTGITNGFSSDITTTYSYQGRTTIQYQADRETILSVQKTKHDKGGRIVLVKSRINLPRDKSTRVTKYKRDDNGKVLLYKLIKDGNLTKKTTHLLINGIEHSQTEEYFDPNYTVKTIFKYEYW